MRFPPHHRILTQRPHRHRGLLKQGRRRRLRGGDRFYGRQVQRPLGDDRDMPLLAQRPPGGGALLLLLLQGVGLRREHRDSCGEGR